MPAVGAAEVPLLEVLPSTASDVQVHACTGPSNSWKIPLLSWIKLVFDQYSDFLRHANADAMDAQCPAKIKTFYDTLSILHAQCSQLPTKVYTMHFPPMEADAWQVRMTTMSGRHVCDVAMPCTGTMNALEHVPQPLYRVAGDGNLYTHQQYTAYYGEEITKEWWSSAAPCYEHRICLLTADSRMTLDALSCTS